ncbi:DNA-binding transcriptional LysR family regulator [Arthrobacter silviterrae]|uniref:LysR family transcriptional regulator n=1 Tax=Arthrobacter silviterrae TaxID=2026658 RepID=A0ABX0DHG4_9MICC|nr:MULTISPECIES: LysR family transcriptional regulator [Arthrobacter]MCU6482342.1 LysR family transcriptional regulator [Arthrobacter sp. A2-55]MDQ0278889.1 DNA-binding transcriptional LysR family regulator [Arthrobacter silviterrae]NGN84865.1 LysR family transcriptional regulator [Arthrobacter silviterrae]
MLNLVHLRTLVEVVRLGSFTAAGNRLGYTASAVSQQMSALEKASNVRLFVRSARSVHPTQAAHAMGQQALKLLRDADNLLAAGKAAGGGAVRELRVGAFPSVAMFVVSQIVKLPHWRDPCVQVNISIGEPSAVVPGLRVGGELDVGIVYHVGESGLALPQGVSRHWLGEDPYKVVVPAGWGFQPGSRLGVEELYDVPWILHVRGSSDANIFDFVLANAGLHPRVVASSDDFNVTLRMVAAGHGVAMVPELAMAECPDGAVVVEVPELALTRKLMALCAEDAPMDLAEEFVEALRNADEFRRIEGGS